MLWLTICSTEELLKGANMKIVRPAVALFVLLFLTAFSKGERLSTPDNKTYELIEKLGSGDFGEVWKVKNIRNGRVYALKLYQNPREAKAHLKQVELLTNGKKWVRRNNLTTVFSPEILTDSHGKSHQALRMELGGQTVQALSAQHFQQTHNLSPQERALRIQETHLLLQNLLAASDQLTDLKLVHHDINPRNILKTNGRYRVNDFDGVTRAGESPPTGAYEFYFGPIEYEAKESKGEFRHLSDLQTIAFTVFFAMFGESPLESFSRLKKQDIETTRKNLWNSENDRTAFQKLVQDKFAELFHSLPNEIMKEFTQISRFVSSAAIIDPQKRQESLLQSFQNLKALKGPLVRSHPGATLSPSRLQSPNSFKKPPEVLLVGFLDEAKNLKELFHVINTTDLYLLINNEAPRQKLFEKAIPWIREITDPTMQKQMAEHILNLTVNRSINGPFLITLPLLSEVSLPQLKEKMAFLTKFARDGRLAEQGLENGEAQNEMLVRLMALAVEMPAGDLSPEWYRENVFFTYQAGAVKRPISHIFRYSKGDSIELHTVASLLSSDFSDPAKIDLLQKAKARTEEKAREISSFRLGRISLNLTLGLLSVGFAYAAKTHALDLGENYQGMGVLSSAAFSMMHLKWAYDYLTKFKDPKYQDFRKANQEWWWILNSHWRNKAEQNAIQNLEENLLREKNNPPKPPSNTTVSCAAMLRGLYPMSSHP